MSHDEMVRTAKVLMILMRRTFASWQPMGPSIRAALETIVKRELTETEWSQVATEIV